MNKGKIAVVTGAGGTLCSAMAIDLAAQGCKVVLVGRDMKKLEVTAEKIGAGGGDCLPLSADVRDFAQMSELRGKVLSAYGQCDILINGAGGNQPDAVTTIGEFEPRELSPDFAERGFFNLKADRFNDVVNVNIMGTVIPCQLFARDMAEKGGGAIINFASMNTYRPLSRIPAYAMSKAAVSNFTQWLAAYLAPAKIRVNAIAPGFFINERSAKLLLTPDGGCTARGANILRQTPMKRFGDAKELLGCMNWLIDDEKAAFVTGVTVPVDGGFLSCSGL